MASVPKRPRSEQHLFCFSFFFFSDIFSYTLLPLQEKTTRPGVLVRNYDLDARCGPPLVVRNPRDGPPNHHGPCCAAALPVPAGLSAAGQGVITLSRASAGALEVSVYCLFALLCPAPPLPTATATAVFGKLTMGGMLRCQGRTSWGGRGGMG